MNLQRVRSRPARLSALAMFGVAVAALAGPVTPARAAGSTSAVAQTHRILGVIPHHPATGHTAPRNSETRVCQGCTPPLYNPPPGPAPQPPPGPVMGTNARPGENTQYAIYWTGAGSIPSSYQGTINQYLTDVAADSGKKSNVYSTDTQYTGASGYLSHFGGAIMATDPLPPNSCPVDAGYSSCLTDQDLELEISRVIAANNLGAARDLAHMFLLFLPQGVESCDSTNSCSANVFCGYHSAFQESQGGPPIIYSNMPYAVLQGCTSGQAPNGDPLADGELDTLSHEINESVTDPLGDAWQDSTGHEDGDECSYIYGSPLGTQADTSNNTQYNQRINGHRYYTQEEFSNDAYNATGAGCIQALAVPVTDSVSVIPASRQIPNDGTSTTQVTATVTTPAPSQAVSGDEVDFATFSRAGACGTVNPTKATTNSSGQAVTTYTASHDNVACTIIASEVSTGGAGQGVVDQGVPGAYHALPPFRLADTRAAAGTYAVDGPSLGPGGTRVVPVRGQDGVPADASAAVLNVTAVSPSSAGFLTAYPSGSAIPATSNLNFVAGQTVANLVTVPIGSDGDVAVYNLAGSTDVVVDLEGYMEPGNSTAGLLNSLAPNRITDTRPGSGQANAGRTLGRNGVLFVQVDGTPGIPSSGVSAVVLNVTAVGASNSSYLTVYGHNSPRPTASNLNFNPGQVVPNRVVVPVTSGGVDIYNLAGTVDAVVDVAGWFSDGTSTTTGARFTPLVPTRVADTRAHSGQPLAGLTIGPASQLAIPAASTPSSAGTLAQGVIAVAGNVTVANTSAPSFLTAYPGGSSRPTASDLNWVAGQVVPNSIITQLGSNDGALVIYNNSGSVDVIVDIFGFWS